ncbi:hypothetical protein AB0D13_02925 [Streptomyces sp. NPDC048430]|uniref:hypothetical protein n=1 Tax=Streptomyces sp. NPDC048430 TaxID=3155388 RepID=UPI00343D4388
MTAEEVLELRRETVRRVLDAVIGWSWPSDGLLMCAEAYEDKYGVIGIVDEVKAKRAASRCWEDLK